MFAHNNADIDYFMVAATNAALIKHHLDIPITIVTDAASVPTTDTDSLDVFDNILYETVDKDNVRLYRDTSAKLSNLDFNNANRNNAYHLSPYDETLLIDCDYMIQSNRLNECWDSSYNVLINTDYEELIAGKNTINKYINSFSIQMYWATVVYFKRCSEAEQLFKFVAHVKKNYGFYKHLYNLPDDMFRNDFAFSIAMHMLDSFTDTKTFHSHLPGKKLYQAFDTSDIYCINGKDDITFASETGSKENETILSRSKGIDVHIMNKWAILRNSQELLGYYK